MDFLWGLVLEATIVHIKRHPVTVVAFCSAVGPNPSWPNPLAQVATAPGSDGLSARAEAITPAPLTH
jgi:hypothetical protein